jgi:hypothetical protein
MKTNPVKWIIVGAVVILLVPEIISGAKKVRSWRTRENPDDSVVDKVLALKPTPKSIRPSPTPIPDMPRGKNLPIGKEHALVIENPHGLQLKEYVWPQDIYIIVIPYIGNVPDNPIAGWNDESTHLTMNASSEKFSRYVIYRPKELPPHAFDRLPKNSLYNAGRLEQTGRRITVKRPGTAPVRFVLKRT